MNETPAKITLDQWDRRYEALRAAGLREPACGGPLRRHLDDGDLRLKKLSFDNSAAALDLWNLLLTEEDRLARARDQGHLLIGTMKDLGTVPVIAYAFDRMTAFYPDGAWWTPCIMELSARSLQAADALGIGESFCPVRAMLGAWATGEHFPRPDLVICSVGATCDDVTAIAQRIEAMGQRVFWWEIPHRRRPDPDEPSVELPGGFIAPAGLVAFVRSELVRVRKALESLSNQQLSDHALSVGIRRANQVRSLLAQLRHLSFTAPACPMPALELLIAEMLTLHFCSDPAATLDILTSLLDEVHRRIRLRIGVLPPSAVRVFWVNPVADLRIMNLLEDCGGRICGTDYLFNHALDQIPEDLPPLEALAQMALADPMVGPAADRADRIVADIQRFGAQAVVISRIPGASHCATEGAVIADVICDRLALPVVELEVPPITDAMEATLRTRVEALIETARGVGKR